MKLYSDFTPRRTRQIFIDVISLGFIAGWIWLGAHVHSLVAELATYGEQIEDAGTGFRVTMTDVGDTLGGIPLIGGGIRTPLDGASDAGGALEQAGRGQQELVHQIAVTLGVGIAVLPTLMILVLWLIPRIRFARRATRAKALVHQGAGIDLLALRALTGQRITTIANISSDAAAAWRRGDEGVMRKLAALELESSGIRLTV